MSTLWLALLKGVNRENVPMPELESALTERGFLAVRSVLEGGNLAFRSEQTRDELEEALREILKSNFGVRTRPVLLKASQFQAVLQDNPVPDKCDVSPGNVHVLFLRKPALQPDFQQIERFKESSEAWYLLDDALYLYTPGDFQKSKLAVRLERLVGVGTAPRSWAEVMDIRQLLDSR